MARPSFLSSAADLKRNSFPLLFIALLSTVGQAADHGVGPTAPTKTGTAIDIAVPRAAFAPGSFRGWDKAGTDPDRLHQLFSTPELWDCSAGDVVNQHAVVSEQLREHPRGQAARVNYETQNGALATKQLTAALHTGSVLAIASVALKFRFTDAGNRAAAMAVLAAADRGYDLSAAYFFNGWFLDNADQFCAKKELHRFVLKGLTLLKTTGLDEEFSSVRKQVETCATFSAGQVTLETLETHFKDMAVEGTQSRLNKEWFEKPNETLKTVEARRNLLKVALTYGTTGPQAAELFTPVEPYPRGTLLTFCDHYDLPYAYLRRFEGELVSDIRTLQALYPGTARALNSDIKAGVIAKYLGASNGGDNAVESVGLLGNVAVPELVAALSGGERTKIFALWALAQIGPEAETAVPAIAALVEPSSKVWEDTSSTAARTLGALGRPGAEELERLLKVNPEITELLRESKTLSTETLGVLLARFDEASSDDKISTLNMLHGNSRNAAFAVDKLIEVLDSEDKHQRDYAMGALSAIGPAAEKALPKLIKMLQHPNPQFRETGAVFSVLANIGPKAGPAMDVVLPQLEEPFGYGNEAERVLAAMGAQVVPAMQSILQRSEEVKVVERNGIRRAQPRAISILRALGPPGVPLLAQTLAHKNGENANLAAEFLGDMGETAAPAIPELYAAMLNSESITPTTVGNTLGKIGKAAKPTIVEAFASENKRGRVGALHALTHFTADPDFAVPLLIKGLKDESPQVREAALRNFRGEHALPETEFDTVVLLTADNSSAVRSAAYQALGQIRSKQSASTIAKGISDENPDVRFYAYDSLAKMGTFAEAAIPAVSKRLFSQKAAHRIEAAQYLAKYGKEPAKELLEKQYNQETDPEVKRVILDMVYEHIVRKRRK